MADQGTEGLFSPFLRRRRIAAARPYLQGRVLDVGCGSGELAQYVRPENYIGFDLDAEVIAFARKERPEFQFETIMPEAEGKFDTVVALAVIEHVADPIEFARKLRAQLRPTASSHIVLTTPHPSIDWIHSMGAKIGIFSAHANEEHEELLDYSALKQVAMQADLVFAEYCRFLLGANQLAILRLE